MFSRTNFKLNISAKKLSGQLTSAIVVLPVFFVLTDAFGVSAIIRLVADFLWICVVALLVFRKKLQMKRGMIPFLALVLVFVLDTLLVYIARYQSTFYYLWGLRNYLRFYVVFFAVAENFEHSTAKGCLAFIDKLFWINFVAAIIQFLMGYGQDYIGGMFGVTKGCNAYLSMYLSVVICYSILLYMNGSETTVKCFLKCAAALVISALAELKFFFFLFILMLIIAMVLTSFSMKKVGLLLVSAILLSLTAAILGSLYSYFEGFLSFESIIDTLTRDNYASATDMGRFSAIGDISDKFLTSVPDRLFGMGLGNCDVSTISIFNTQFYDTYGDLHYSIYSYSFMFLENGYIGLIIYVLFFVFCLIAALRRRKMDSADPLFCQMGIIMSVTCLILIFYNSSLRTEAGFMMYFALALPFVEREKHLSAGKMLCYE